MNNALQALLEKKRPFHEFEYEGQKLYARKMGSTDEASIAQAHNDVYESYVFDEEASKKIEQTLRKSSKEDLADYILIVDEREMTDEAAKLFSKPREHEEVKEYVKEQVAQRKATLISEDFDILLTKALDRRLRIAALTFANEQFLKEAVLRTVYTEDEDGNKKPLFSSLEQLGELPSSDIRALNQEVNKALLPGDPFRTEQASDSAESVDDSKKTRGRRRNPPTDS